MSADEITFCPPHYYVRRRWALFRPRSSRWRCLLCGGMTRYYDTVDGRGMRPLHENMSVAVKGINAWPGRIP